MFSHVIVTVLLISPVDAKMKSQPPVDYQFVDCSKDDIPIRLASDLAVEHYQRDGIWAGVFRIDQIVERRLERIDDGMILHMRYRYQPIPGNRFERTDTGFDQRTFLFQCELGWRVIDMGAHFSASFP